LELTTYTEPNQPTPQRLNFYANITQKVGEYPYTLVSTIFHNREHQECCNDSILLQRYDVESLSGFLELSFSKEEIEYLQQEQKIKIEKHNKTVVISKSKTIDEHFKKVDTKKRETKLYMKLI